MNQQINRFHKVFLFRDFQMKDDIIKTEVISWETKGPITPRSITITIAILAHNIILKSCTHLTVCTEFASFADFREYRTSHIPGGQRSLGHGDPPPLLQQQEVTRLSVSRGLFINPLTFSVRMQRVIDMTHVIVSCRSYWSPELTQKLHFFTMDRSSAVRFRHERDGEEEKQQRNVDLHMQFVLFYCLP